MCAHSESASDITGKLSGKLYPFIDVHFDEVLAGNQRTPPGEQLASLFSVVYALREEFHSLCHYEAKLVFPSVLKVFNTKDDPDFSMPVNIRELQSLTGNKEKRIAELTDDLFAEAEHGRLPKDHPVYALIYLFRNTFREEKKRWNDMLNGWNNNCTCFSAVLRKQQETKDIAG